MWKMKTNNELTPAQESFRRGSTTYHAARALMAKKILGVIRAHRGITKDAICEEIGTNSTMGAFDMLREHGLIFYQGQPRVYFSTGRNPR